jgi:2-dehydropantoate 2-reductase
MRIGLIGAGAIGGWVAARLAAVGADLHLLARGATLLALKRGLVLEEAGARRAFPVRAVAGADEIGIVDLLLIATKSYSFRDAAAAAVPMIGPATMILPMHNGVPWWFLGGDAPLSSIDPDGAIGRLLPAAQVIGSVVHASCRRAGPADIVHIAGNGIILGEPGGGETARLDSVAALLRSAGFDATTSDAIRRAIWYKLWGNMTMNPLSALTGATADHILDEPLIRPFIVATMDEAAAIGARIGCAIEESAEDRIAVTRRLGAFKTSMLQDAEAGRPLEVEALLGAPCEIAARLGMAVPNLATLYGLTRLRGVSAAGEH